MKPVARQRRQPCVLGRYSQPGFYMYQPAAQAQAVVIALASPGCGGDGARFSRRRGSISEIDYASVGQRRSCQIAVGRFRRDLADLAHGVDNLLLQR